MPDISTTQIRRYRLHAHNLTSRLPLARLTEAAGACGMQNTPPGAWESALFNRVNAATPAIANEQLSPLKSLLQAWSFRGAPVVFPADDSSTFLTALLPEQGEEWIYTRGIGLALDTLGLPFDWLLNVLLQVIPGLDNETITSKTALDQTLAGWMLPLIPAGKRDLWVSPSMYGQPGTQTVGGAVVSFLLRPCALLGLVVFGERAGNSPTFTSYSGWLGHPLLNGNGRDDAIANLTRKFIHCYGPTTPAAFATWLGCSSKQARRMWASMAAEIQSVTAAGCKAFMLTDDLPGLANPPTPERSLMLLGGHDPYLDQRDRHILLPDKALQRKVWQTVSNPGVILCDGEIIGTWTGALKGKGMRVRMELWPGHQVLRQRLTSLADEYAAFRAVTLVETIIEDN